MKNKKIFLYTPSLQRGGVYHSNKLLAKGFKNKGYEVKIITNRKTDLKIEGFEHIHLNAGDFARPFKLKNIILKEEPLAIFASMQTQNVSLALSRLLLKNKNIKTKFFGFIRTTDAFVKYGNKPFKAPFRFFIKKMYQQLDKIIAVSTLAKKDIQRTFFLSNDDIAVVNNPVDIQSIDILKNYKISREEDEFLRNSIIFVGRFTKSKGIFFILEIFKNLKNHKKDLNLVLLGDGEEKENICSFIEKENIDDVYILPFSENPFKYIVRSKLLLLASYDEGFPRVVVESFACGTPVVAFVNEFSGHVDIIDDGKNGFLVPFGDIDQFVEKVKLLLENEDLRKEFSKNAIEKAKQFELDKIISKLEELIYT